MNAHLPQGAQNRTEAMKIQEGREQEPIAAIQQRTDLSLELRRTNNSFGEKVEEYIERGEAEEMRKRMEQGEKPKEFSWMTLSAYVAAGAVGAIGAYKLTNWGKSLFKNDEEGEKKGLIEKGKDFVEKTKEFPWGWGLGLLTATGFVFRGSFFEWIQKAFNFSIENQSLEKFVKILREKGPKGMDEAYEQLVYKTRGPHIAHFANELNVTNRHLAELQTVGYKHFLEQRAKDSKKSYLTKGMEWAGVEIEKIPFTKIDDELQRVGEENRIADYIKKHKSELDLSEKDLLELTIGEIFQKFLALKVPEKRPARREGEDLKEGPDKSPEKSGLKITDDPEKIKEELPATAEALILANNVQSSEEKAIIITEGVLKDGGTLVQTEWGTFVAKGATGILISSGTILAEEFKHAGLFVYNLGKGDTHSAAENLVDGAITWHENGGVWFLGTGMAMGATAALWKGESITRGLAAGGLKGALLGPVGAIWNTMKVIKASEQGIAKVLTEADYQWARTQSSGESLKNLFTKETDKVDVLKTSTERHMREYEKYFELRQRARSGNLSDTHIGRLNTLQPEHFEKMELYHFTQVRNHWLAFKKAQGDANPKFPFDLENFRGDKTGVDEFMRKFREENGFTLNQRQNLDDALNRLSSNNVNKLSIAEKIDALKESSREADEYMQSFIKNIKKMHLEGKPQTEIDTYTQEARKHLEEVRNKYKDSFEELKRNAPNMTKNEQIALKNLIETEFTHAKGVRGVMREVGERGTGKIQLVFGVAAIGLEYLEATNEQKEAYAAGKIYSWGKEFGFDVIQIIADILSPFGASDWYTVATGKEFFTGEEASDWNRFTRVIFGAYNLGADTLAAIGGAATAEAAGAGGAAIYGTSNTIEGALRAAGKSDKVIDAAKAIVPEIQGLAKALGGYQELFRVMKNISSKGMIGVTAAEVSILGYELLFDTKDQELLEIDLPLAKKPGEKPLEEVQNEDKQL